MKKIKLVSFFALIVFVGCKKNDSLHFPDPGIKSASNWEIKNATLRINTIASFEEILKPEAKGRDKIINALKLANDNRKTLSSVNDQNSNSEKLASNSCVIPSETFEENRNFLELLNSDGVISIEKYSYKLDYCKHKLYTISNQDVNDPVKYAAFIDGNTNEGGVGQFPLYVDVLAAIEQGYTTMPDYSSVRNNDAFRIFGGLIGGQRFHEEMYWQEKYDQQWNPDERMDGLISYDAFGVFFHFYAKEKYQIQNSLGWFTTTGGSSLWNVVYDATYTPRRRNQESEYRVVLYPEFGIFGSENKLRKTFYQGVRRLVQAYCRWDVGRDALAKRIMVKRGQTQTAVSTVFDASFVNFTNPPPLQNFLGTYTTSVNTSMPFTFSW